MNCGTGGMARKANLSRQMQELHGQAEITDRRPADLVTALYLMQLRANARTISQPRRRLAIVMEREPLAQMPQPVRIVRVG